MRWVEELGSGKMNIRKSAPLYYNKFTIDILNAEKFFSSLLYKDVVEDGGINAEDGGIKFLISNIKHIKATTKLELVKVALLVQEFGGIRSCCYRRKNRFIRYELLNTINLLSTNDAIELRGSFENLRIFLKRDRSYRVNQM